MYQNKKIIMILIVVLSVVLLISGCNNAQEEENNEPPVNEVQEDSTDEENNETEEVMSNISEEGAKILIQDYLEKLYTIEDFRESKYSSIGVIEDRKDIEKITEINETIKPYMTERGYQEILVDRYVPMIRDFASNRQGNLLVESIDLRLENKREDRIFYWYDVTLLLKHLDDTEKEMTIKGQVNITKVDKVLKIDKDNIMESHKFYDPYDNRYITDQLHSIVAAHPELIYKQINSYIPRMYFAISNLKDEKIELNFSTSQQFELKLYQDEKEVWDYGESEEFREESISIMVEPGEHLVYYVNFPEAIQQGNYTYEFKSLDDQFNGVEPLTGEIDIFKATEE